MLWRIYYGLNVVVLLLILIGIFSTPIKYIPINLLYGLSFSFAVFGLYCFLFRKHFLPSKFWQYFLFASIAFDLFYTIHVIFPNFVYLSFLAISDDESNLLLSLAGTLYSIPLYYVNYKLAKNEYLEKKESKEQALPGHPRWGMIQIAIWGYSTVLILLSLIFSFLPANTASEGSSDPITGALFFAPLTLFWILVVLYRKQYFWNWWKTLLATTSFVYSVIFLAGSLSPLPSAPSEFDILNSIPLITTFVSLVLFGREHFIRLEKNNFLSPDEKVKDTTDKLN